MGAIKKLVVVGVPTVSIGYLLTNPEFKQFIRKQNIQALNQTVDQIDMIQADAQAKYVEIKAIFNRNYDAAVETYDSVKTKVDKSVERAVEVKQKVVKTYNDGIDRVIEVKTVVDQKVDAVKEKVESVKEKVEELNNKVSNTVQELEKKIPFIKRDKKESIEALPPPASVSVPPVPTPIPVPVSDIVSGLPDAELKVTVASEATKTIEEPSTAESKKIDTPAEVVLEESTQEPVIIQADAPAALDDLPDATPEIQTLAAQPELSILDSVIVEIKALKNLKDLKGLEKIDGVLEILQAFKETEGVILSEVLEEQAKHFKEQLRF